MPSIASHIEAALFLIYPKSATPTQIAEYVRCSRKTACRLLYNAHNGGVCHITGWCPEHQGIRQSWVPLYAFGGGKDIPKPPPLSSWERERERKARKMKEPTEGVQLINNIIISWGSRHVP